MENKSEKKHRKSIRLKGFDYSAAGYYFVTICTHEHQSLFGNICSSKMQLTTIGKIANEFWRGIPDHSSSVDLDYYVIMPNHIHGIIIIENRGGVQSNAPSPRMNAPTPRNEYYSGISPQKDSLSVILRTFKAAVTRWCKQNGFEDFKWQRGYYDRIIRNEKELFYIRQYIINNPLKWELDRENPANWEKK